MRMKLKKTDVFPKNVKEEICLADVEHICHSDLKADVHIHHTI